MHEGFDDHVKFFFAEEGREPVLPRQNVSSLDWPSDGRPISKDYTPVRFGPVAGEIDFDFDFVRHDGGKDVTAPAERAGLTVRACRDVGRDHRLWVPAPTA
ncbi:siderophore-interacting protein [Streptomyces sp. NPDC054945]